MGWPDVVVQENSVAAAGPSDARVVSQASRSNHGRVSIGSGLRRNGDVRREEFKEEGYEEEEI